LLGTLWAITGSKSTAAINPIIKKDIPINTIRDLLARDLSRKIEEVIQVDQADEHSVYAEISEYVATDSIREQHHD